MDPRSAACCVKHGVTVWYTSSPSSSSHQADHSARQIREQDLYDYKYVLCMDRDNLLNVKKLQRRWYVC